MSIKTQDMKSILITPLCSGKLRGSKRVGAKTVMWFHMLTFYPCVSKSENQRALACRAVRHEASVDNNNQQSSRPGWGGTSNTLISIDKLPL